MDPRQALEKVGNVAIGAFGDRVLIGVLLGFLDDETPGLCYKRITENAPLFDFISDEDWQMYAEKAKRVNFKDITVERVAKELKKHRNDLYSVIIKTPGGADWLRAQVDTVRQKMGIT